MEVKIIPFESKYAEHFYLLNYDWLDEYFYVEPYDEQVLKNCKEEIIDKGGYIFFALHKDQVVGTMALLPRDDSIYELNKMAVQKELRGKGIGNQLIQFTIDFCKEKKFKSIILYSNTVLNNSIYLYKKYGFKEIKSEGDTPYKRSDIKMEMQLVYS